MKTEYICNGGCCQRFFIARTPAEFTALKNSIESGETEDKWDNLQISSMVIPIEECNENEKIPGWWYTCKNLDTETNLCKIYDARPEMCKGYPYGDECKNCGSTCGTEKTVREAGGISATEIASRLGE